MFLSKKKKLLKKIKEERAKIKEMNEKSEVIKKFLGEIDEIILFSLINLSSRGELMELSILHTDKILWEAFESKIKNPENLKYWNVRKTYKMVKDLRERATDLINQIK